MYSSCITAVFRIYLEFIILESTNQAWTAVFQVEVYTVILINLFFALKVASQKIEAYSLKNLLIACIDHKYYLNSSIQTFIDEFTKITLIINQIMLNTN